MTYESLMIANQTITKIEVKGKEYAEVNQRIRVFRMLYPNGSIETNIESLEKGICVMSAVVKDDFGSVLGVGHAYEKEDSSFINKTSYIENCETWDKKFIIAEEIAVIVPIPESVLDDSDYDIWGEVKPRVTEAFGTKIDGAALFGVDKPSTWRDDIVTTATKAGSVVTLGSADPLYDKIMAEEGVLDKVEKCGYLVNGHMADVSMRAKLRGLKNANGDPLFKSDMQGSTQYALDGSPMNFPINGAWDKSKALMVSGDFSQLVFSIRQDITFKLFTEGVVQNTDGTIAYNLMQNDMVALRAVMRMGWEVPNPINALAKDKTKRCPFSILKAGE